uniref:Uncharacterized protein n=1 Tax=Populus alba TaxID=43335 RepID=A0A4U5M4H0_POPAL|nr:hypothetical protein D5086_0000323280 [Populus alba]
MRVVGLRVKALQKDESDNRLVGGGGVIEKELEFKPSFGEYLKAMESVKTGREKNQVHKSNSYKLKDDLEGNDAPLLERDERSVKLRGFKDRVKVSKVMESDEFGENANGSSGEEDVVNAELDYRGGRIREFNYHVDDKESHAHANLLKHHARDIDVHHGDGVEEAIYFTDRIVANFFSERMRSKDRIAYFDDGDVGSVYFGPNHPMKPHRLCMTHHLVLSYELHKKMEIYRPHKAYPVELAQFHSEDYVEFLHRITPDTQHFDSNSVVDGKESHAHANVRRKRGGATSDERWLRNGTRSSNSDLEDLNYRSYKLKGNLEESDAPSPVRHESSVNLRRFNNREKVSGVMESDEFGDNGDGCSGQEYVVNAELNYRGGRSRKFNHKVGGKESHVHANARKNMGGATSDERWLRNRTSSMNSDLEDLNYRSYNLKGDLEESDAPSSVRHESNVDLRRFNNREKVSGVMESDEFGDNSDGCSGQEDVVNVELDYRGGRIREFNHKSSNIVPMDVLLALIQVSVKLEEARS